MDENEFKQRKLGLLAEYKKLLPSMINTAKLTGAACTETLPELIQDGNLDELRLNYAKSFANGLRDSLERISEIQEKIAEIEIELGIQNER